MSDHTNSLIAILGGSGKAGRPFVEQILQAGYRVRLLLRHPEQWLEKDARIEIVHGDARDPLALRQLLSGCEVLASTLGNRKGENTPMLSGVTQNVLSLMQELGIRRYVTVTSLYTTDRVQTDEKTQKAAEFMEQHFPQFMADRLKEYQLLKKSALDWTYVRLPYLIQQPPTGNVQVNLEYLPGQQITVEDLAQFLASQLTDRTYVRKAPFVANG
jgi:putative NADH-flavin reductase